MGPGRTTQGGGVYPISPSPQSGLPNSKEGGGKK